jgi:hypothetical protein
LFGSKFVVDLYQIINIMKKYILPLVLALSIFSCKTVQLTDGTYITKKQEKKIYEKVFSDTFGQMTEEEVQLFEGVNVTVDTSVVVSDTSERVINVFTDTSYVVEPTLTAYKELFYSYGDTTVLYDMEMIIIDGVSRLNFDTTTFYNCKAVIVYR